MSKILKYSILRYVKKPDENECINLGILFSDQETGFRDFIYNKEISKDVPSVVGLNEHLINVLLKSIRNEVTNEIYKDNNFDINKYTKHFKNEFSFSIPVGIEYENLVSTINSLLKGNQISHS